jgi:hypothetical protein
MCFICICLQSLHVISSFFLVFYKCFKRVLQYVASVYLDIAKVDRVLHILQYDPLAGVLLSGRRRSRVHVRGKRGRELGWTTFG